MKIKIRDLPDGAAKLQGTDRIAIAQTSGGNATRYISASNLVVKSLKAGSNISIGNDGKINVTTSKNIDAELNSIKSRVSALESGGGTQYYIDGTHANSGGSGQSTPSTKVLNHCKSALPGIKNCKVTVRWYRYWSWGTGNGSASKTQYFFAIYNVNASGVWTHQRNIHIA